MSESIVDRIRITAKGKGLTVKEVGIQSEVGENAIYRWKDKKPNLETLMKVADFLGVSLDYLVYGKGKAPESLGDEKDRKMAGN